MKLINKLNICAIISLAFLSPAATAQDKQSTPKQFTSGAKSDSKSKELIAELEKSIPQLMKDGEVPGLLLSFIKKRWK